MSEKDEKLLEKAHTVFVGRGNKAKKENVVLNQEEWNRAIAEADEAAAKKAAELAAAKEAAEEASGMSRASRRSTRSKKPKEKEAKKADTGEKEKKPKKKSKVGKIILWIILVCIILGLIACGVVAYIVSKIIKETPEINPNNIYDLLSQSSSIYDKDGNLIENIFASGEGLRTNIDYDEMPKELVQAFVSIEDKTFFEHHGFNFVRMVGAVRDKLIGRSKKISGTSTITQQLARNIFLTDTKDVHSYKRKIQEAYYTIVIERELSKEKIVEAYLNTVFLGYNTNGVYAAANAYFNKDVKDLTLLECAQLAALPQSPNAYAPLKRISRASYEASENKDKIDVVTENDVWVVYYNDTASGRIKTVLDFMHEQGKISDEVYQETRPQSIRPYLNPGLSAGESVNDSSYYTDFVVKQVLADLQNKLGYSYQDAYDLLYKGGLVINTTLDLEIQGILESAYADKNNFPKINLNSLNLDKQKNILNSDKTRIVLYAKNILFDADGNLVIAKDEYKKNPDGSVTFYKGKRLNFYNTKANGETDVRVDIKDMYEMVDGQMYTRSGSVWNMASKYKTRDNDGNLVVSAAYFTDYPDMFIFKDNGELIYKYETGKKDVTNFNLATEIIQPQSAMVIIESATGHIRGMIGGRDITGKLLFNRATATRQPGSSIKPLTVYSGAIQHGYDVAFAEEETEILDEFGNPVEDKIFTAATPLDNIPINLKNSLWPQNFDRTYSGITSLRRAVERSYNGCAVNLYQQLEPKDLIAQLQNLGVSSLVLGDADSDENPSALALGGMMKGISPLEMASAYTTFGNYGVHNDESCYTTVTNRKGDIILQSEVQSIKVYDEEVASLMVDILRTTVEHGIAGGAKLKSQPSAGKTGTTSDMNDIWFCGITPKYAASAWIGCDSNISLGTDSSKATKLWSAVMDKVGAMDERGEFELRGEFVTLMVDRATGMLPSESEYADIDESDLITEIFIKGTEPTVANEDARGYIQVCAITGYLAGPECPVAYKSYIVRPGGRSWEAMLSEFTLTDPQTHEDIDKAKYLTIIPDSGKDLPEFYCPMHRHGEIDENGEFIPSEDYPISPIAREVYDLTGVVQTGGHYEYNGEEYIWVADPIEEYPEEGTEEEGIPNNVIQLPGTSDEQGPSQEQAA